MYNTQLLTERIMYIYFERYKTCYDYIINLGINF